MNITLANLATIVGIWKDVLLGLAALVTASVAVFGVNSWLRELRGKTEYAAALALMRATYALREALFNFRSPLIESGEFPAGFNLVAHSADADEKAKAYSYVFRARFAPVQTCLKEFDATALEAEAIWGAGARVAADTLSACVNTIYAAVQAYVANEISGGEDFKADRDFAKEIRSTVFGSRTAKDNAMTIRILESVKALEAFAGPHLKRQSVA